ncbi:MAG: thioredoxin family protein [Candidatus Obscuribacterales bacterium]|nr:thioredoxin family protein [Candidatus Obscuribacterales bacterium]
MKNKVVSKEEWIAERKKLLVQEKEMTKLKDQLTKQRQELPWVKIDKEYVFQGTKAKETLSDLFEGKSQLIVYHFMFQPDWTEGCKSCSLIADHYEPSLVHLKQRDVNMVTISRAPIDRLEAFRKRMGWSFKWVSSNDSDFNIDFNVSFPGDLKEQKEVYYNYGMIPAFPSTEGPGMSVFYKDEDGTIFHTYSCFARGLEKYLTVYDLLDVVPKGRDEDGLVYGMEWVRHHDKYGDESFKDIYVELLAGRKSD